MKSKIIMSSIALLFTSNSFAAVAVTCVCSRYELNKDEKLKSNTVEIYTTTKANPSPRCTDDAVNTKYAEKSKNSAYFNCKMVAKEDLLQESQQ